MTSFRFDGLAAALLLCGCATVVQAAPAAAGDPLAAERWKTRPLVIVAPTMDDPMIAGVRRELAATALRDAFDEREMVLYTVAGDEARRNDQPLPAGQAEALRQALSIDAGAPAEALLIGKDGGIKLRQSGRVDFGVILPTIDAMPMRQR